MRRILGGGSLALESPNSHCVASRIASMPSVIPPRRPPSAGRPTPRTVLSPSSFAQAARACAIAWSSSRHPPRRPHALSHQLLQAGRQPGASSAWRPSPPAVAPRAVQRSLLRHATSRRTAGAKPAPRPTGATTGANLQLFQLVHVLPSQDVQLLSAQARPARSARQSPAPPARSPPTLRDPLGPSTISSHSTSLSPLPPFLYLRPGQCMHPDPSQSMPQMLHVMPAAGSNRSRTDRSGR